MVMEEARAMFLLVRSINVPTSVLIDVGANPAAGRCTCLRQAEGWGFQDQGRSWLDHIWSLIFAHVAFTDKHSVA